MIKPFKALFQPPPIADLKRQAREDAERQLLAAEAALESAKYARDMYLARLQRLQGEN